MLQVLSYFVSPYIALHLRDRKTSNRGMEDWEDSRIRGMVNLDTEVKRSEDRFLNLYTKMCSEVLAESKIAEIHCISIRLY